LTGLTDGTTYTVTVAAYTDAGLSPNSDPVTATPASPTLPETVPTGDGPLSSGTGAQFTPDNRTTTLTGTGFAPNSPVTVGIYSSLSTLVTTVSDSSGNVSVQVTIPAGYQGSHTLAISGLAPDGGPRVLTLGVTVAATVSPTPAPATVSPTPASTRHTLPVTGPPIGPLMLAGLVLVVTGVALALPRRNRARHRPRRG
jgi:hypothetical protein